LARAQGDESQIADALLRLGNLAGFLGDFQGEAKYQSESANLCRAVGSRMKRSAALSQLGQAHWFCGEFEQAYATIERSMAVAEESGAPEPLLYATAYRAWLDAAAGRYDAARTYAQRGISLYQRSGTKMSLTCLGLPKGLLGWVAVAKGGFRDAVQPLQESITTFQEIHYWYLSEEFVAWVLAALGRAELGLGNRAKARQHLLQALEIVVEIRAYIPLLHLMPIIPVLLAEEEDLRLKERAVELYAMAESHPFVARAQLFEDVAARYIRAATASLPPEVIEQAHERGRTLDWWETAEALLNELDW
jgi:tetratricopeptide (TPR) repeat protein